MARDKVVSRTAKRASRTKGESAAASWRKMLKSKAKVPDFSERTSRMSSKKLPQWCAYSIKNWRRMSSANSRCSDFMSASFFLRAESIANSLPMTQASSCCAQAKMPMSCLENTL